MAVSNPHRGCVQFSLRTVFILLTLSALLLGVVFAMPADQADILFLGVLWPVPTVLGICAIYSRGYRRTFAIGACIPAVIAFLSPFFIQILFYGFDDFDVNSPTQVRLLVLAYVVGAVLFFLANGALAVLVRWLVEERQEPGSDAEAEVPAAESPFDAETPSD